MTAPSGYLFIFRGIKHQNLIPHENKYFKIPQHRLARTPLGDRLGANGKYSPQDAETVLRRRMGVCAGYAELMCYVCIAARLHCQEIHGFAKGYGYTPGDGLEGTNHAWNVIQINGKWELMDACWAAPDEGEEELEYQYFCAVPSQFLTSHLPEAPRWQLVSQPISLRTFAKNPFVFPSFHEQGFQLMVPITPTLIPNGAVQTVRLVRENADELEYRVIFEDNAGIERTLETRVQATSDGVALRFVLPVHEEGKLLIYTSEGAWYTCIATYGVAGKPAVVAVN